MKTKEQIEREIDEESEYSFQELEDAKEERLRIEFNKRFNDIKSFCKDISSFNHLSRREKMNKIIGLAEFYLDEEDKLYKKYD